jgi:phage-related protein
MEVVFNVVYYVNKHGKSDVKDYIDSLSKKTDKDSRIKTGKIAEYILQVQTYGTSVGKPIITKLIGTDLWELRPLKDRIFFAYWRGNTFVLLHHFIKKSSKTPKKEILQAERNLRDWIERFGE